MLYVTALQEGFLYGLLALGVFISLRVLNIPDLTTEGSFGFGNAVAAVAAAAGYPRLSLLLALFAGLAAGLTTGLLQTKLKVHPVLAGIITMSGLYSINLMVRGGPNLSIGRNTLFKMAYVFLGDDATRDDKKLAGTMLAGILCIAVIALMILFFKTHLGMCIRATGDNPDMVRASSINVDRTKIIGLCVSNGLIALSGALIAHYVGYSDASSSSGTLIYGLAAVIIGEALFSLFPRGKRGVTVGLISAVCGSIIYKMIVTFVVDAELFGKNSANLMKLLCAVIVAITLIIPAVKEYIGAWKNRLEARRA
jgi:putative ABC transport system permease protein